VVGGGSGIGRAVVDAFVAEGAHVGVLERDADKCAALRTVHPDVAVTEGDAVTFAANHDAVRATVGAFGGLDTLVSCVGVFDYYRGLGDLGELELLRGFDELLATNVLSMLVSAHAALPHLRAARGSIVLTASTSSFMPGRGGVLYVASKFAVRGAVIALAHELAPDVRVNAVAPGGTLGTDLRGLVAFGEADRALGATPGREEELRARTPLHTALTAADVAASYVFLAADEAKGMTGRFLHPDGGAGVA
jgi:NAD(P)-dependent dehydrogenase (short-subunit alcohol dehydrogenase family)